MLKTSLTLFSCAALGSLFVISPISAQNTDEKRPAAEAQADQNKSKAEQDRSEQGKKQQRTADAHNNKRAQADQSMNDQIANWLMIDQQATLKFAENAMQKTEDPDVQELLKTVIEDHQNFAESLSSMESASKQGAEHHQKGNQDRNANNKDDAQAQQTAANKKQGEQNKPLPKDEDEDNSRDIRPEIADADADAVSQTEAQAAAIERAKPTGKSQITVPPQARIQPPSSDEAKQQDGHQEDKGDVHETGYRGAKTSSPWVGIHDEISQKLVSHSLKDLEQREGHDRNAAIVGMLLASHLEEEATMAVLEKHADGELQQKIADARKIVSQHRQSAESLMETLKEEPANK
ncbi:MAG: hypothetical protein CMJ46_06035 [Planctomyces sp.]|nr:hypothetical protein [Planctomyces sp.]